MNSEMIKEMVQKDRAAWDSLTAILDVYPEGNLHSPNSPPWTSRDIYAHLARWMSHSNQNMKEYGTRKSNPETSENFEELNTRWQREDSWMTLSEAREKARKTFEERLQIIKTIPPERWDNELERIAHYDGAEHLIAHRGYICVRKEQEPI